MKYPEERIAFTVKDVTHACGISRATLLRLEESGFLKPYRIDEATGYRYYDANNIAQIGQYQLMQDLGFSRKEITDLYYQRTELGEYVKEQRLKIRRIERLLDELEMRYDRQKDYIFSYTELPEETCYCLTVSGDSTAAAETLSYNAYQHMIKEGFQVCGKESFFLLMPELQDGVMNYSIDVEMTLCFPVVLPKKTDERIITFPATKAFSMIGHGNYDSIPALIKRFWEEAAVREIKPAGRPRLIALVAPYVGEHFAEEDFCFEYVVPVEEEN